MTSDLLSRANRARARLADLQERLQTITAGCRDDMHEPDEQDLRVRVVGDHLDNTFGHHIDADAIAQGYQEFVVCFERVMGNRICRERINLADLIALARMATLETAQ